jgi:hypothetical protein
VTATETKNCARCGERLPLDEFYFVSKKLGTRRGQCKACMREIKMAQRDSTWLPECARCGERRPRSGPGRRLCTSCFEAVYDDEERGNGSHRPRLKPCSSCGAKRLRGDHIPGGSLCPICRGVPQGRRTKLKTLYNLTPREYVALMDTQGEACAICGKRSKSLHIDHQHREPSLLRGGLCNACNTMIGLALDNPDRLRAAAVYLEMPPAQGLFPGRAAAPAANRVWNKLKRVPRDGPPRERLRAA